MIGGYYQESELNYYNMAVRNTVPLTVLFPKTPVRQDGTAWSFFGQAMLALTPQLELSGGGRYSYEKKDYFAFTADGAPQPTASPGNDWDNFSPEVTLAWRPNPDLTLYAAYKTGFLSGGFAVQSGDLLLDRSYDQQTIKGVEGGVKFQTPDGALRGDLIGYYYDTKGLQVSANVLLPNGTTDNRFVNAEGARSKGVEASLHYQATDAFRLYGALGYNHGRYKELITPCYRGQTPAAGCNLVPNTAGTAFTSQNLDGERMVRAPDWSIQGGAGYRIDVGNADHVDLSTDINFSSGYFANPSNNPDSWQGKYATVDAGISYTSDALGITVGLFGRNLTDKRVFDRAIDASFTGSGTGTNNVMAPDVLASVARGREVMVRLMARFR